MQEPFGSARYFGKVVLLAALYILTGKLGLLIAVPPGYATIIWPPSGIALGMLVLHGWRLWPGVMIGSFALNGYILGIYSPEQGLILAKASTAFGIAAGSAVQALAGRALIHRLIGLPLRLNRVKDVLWVFVLAGPLACLIAASAGTGALYLSGTLSAQSVPGNWLAWWTGDVFGITVFLPLMLIAPGSPNRLIWRNSAVGALPTVAMLALVVPLGLTFYGWKIASENVYRQGRTEFEALAVESEKALLQRLNSYKNALLGGTGFFAGSQFVSRQAWRNYVQAIQLEKNFPGISGMGWIKPVGAGELSAYLRSIRRDGAAGFTVHPASAGPPYYVITYLEPEEENRQALGLNIAFENHRLQAAELARDTGAAAITRRIILLQDKQKTPGFLLLHPLYRAGRPIDTKENRQAAFEGWIYAPFIARNFLNDLTRSQRYHLNLKIYDGGEESSQLLIFSSGPNTNAVRPAFTVRKRIEVMQRQWLMVWESTPAFEQGEQTEGPLFILVAGLLFTGLFGLFLLTVTVRRMETMAWLVEERQFALPLLIFIILASGGYALYATLQEKELAYVRALTRDEMRKIELLLTTQVDDKLLALKRMAQRWEIAGGTSFQLWQGDARNYTRQLSGLKAVEWVDSSYHIRWVEPVQSNEKAIGLNIIFDEQRARALQGAAEKNSPTLTPPLKLVQGYTAFIAYLPLTAHGAFDGFLAGIFSTEEFFGKILNRELADHYAFSMRFEGKDYFTNSIPEVSQNQRWAIEKSVRIYDKQWTLRIVPTTQFIDSQKTWLPLAVLVAGLLIAALSALSVRYILVSRLRAGYLQASSKALENSEERYDLAVRGMSVGLWDWNVRTNELYWSEKFKEIVGVSNDDFVPHYDEFAGRLHPDDKDTTLAMLFGHVEGRNPYNVEYRLQHNDGHYVWIHAYGQAKWDAAGKAIRMAGSVDDITARKQAEEALTRSEETFRTAMDHAPIGQALVRPDGRWLKVNPALCQLLGYGEAELLANNFQSITHPDDLEVDLTSLREVLDDKLKTYQIEKRYYRKNGQVIWALLSVSLVRRANGEPDYLIAQIQDITERKEMERMKSEFISVVSHELRTPLTSIRGSLGLIMGALSKDLPEKVRGLIDIAHNNCERLVLLINDILDIDKIASGHMRFDMKPESLAVLTLQAVQANEAYARKFNVHLKLEPIDGSMEVELDAARYIQVLSNLISNAAKFSPPGGTVEVAVNPVAGGVRIHVKDHGVGIPEEFRTRIFGKFSQADSSTTRTKGGTGLGLHITKQLVEHMHGRIGFDTPALKGTIFWVEFPLVDVRGQD